MKRAQCLLKIYASTLFVCLLFPSISFADCSGFAADVGQTFGVSLKRDPETRKVLGFYMVGEASFVAPKSSLVRKAKKKAFSNAKADFVRFMKEDFVATDLISDLTNTIETTDNDGNTSGTAEEISAMVETMASNSSAVLSGIVVLGECVDVDSKLVMVQAGWKPELSEVAADAKQNIKKSVAKGDADNENLSQSTQNSTNGVKNSGNQSRNKKVGVSHVSIEVEGEGKNLKQATNEAIRSAIAQVRGEKFASSQVNTDFTVSAEVSSSLGVSAGVSAETSTQFEIQSSEVSGIVSGYRYKSKTEITNGMKVVIVVEIPQYESSMDKSKNSLVVVEPKIQKYKGENPADAVALAKQIQNNLEISLNESGAFNVLDREYLGQRGTELKMAVAGNQSMSELSRLGQLAGADFMLVLEFESIEAETSKKQVGNNLIVRKIFNGSGNYKLIEVASTNIITAGNIPIRKMKFRVENAYDQMGQKVSLSVEQKVLQKFGKRAGNVASANMEAEDSVSESTKRAEESLEKTKEKLKDDW